MDFEDRVRRARERQQAEAQEAYEQEQEKRRRIAESKSEARRLAQQLEETLRVRIRPILERFASAYGGNKSFSTSKWYGNVRLEEKLHEQHSVEQMKLNLVSVSDDLKLETFQDTAQRWHRIVLSCELFQDGTLHVVGGCRRAQPLAALKVDDEAFREELERILTDVAEHPEKAQLASP